MPEPRPPSLPPGNAELQLGSVSLIRPAFALICVRE